MLLTSGARCCIASCTCPPDGRCYCAPCHQTHIQTNWAALQVTKNLLRFWVATLTERTDWNLVLRLHPRMPREQFAFLEEIGGRITDEDTAHLVPLCNLYVASVSATIRWAIACGKPVVNYDVYRFGYTDYTGVPGVFTVNEKQAFVDIIQSLTNDPARLAAAAAAQDAVREQWGRFDGGAAVRFLALVDRKLIAPLIDSQVKEQQRLAFMEQIALGGQKT